MRNAKLVLSLAAIAAACLGSAADAAQRRVRVNTGAHAATMNRVYQANQQHNAVINSVQRNINSNLRRN